MNPLLRFIWYLHDIWKVTSSGRAEIKNIKNLKTQGVLLNFDSAFFIWDHLSKKVHSDF